jgi:hypothetical protein
VTEATPERYAKIIRTDRRGTMRGKSPVGAARHYGKPVAYETRSVRPIVKSTHTDRSVRQTTVVKSSKNTVVRGKKDLSAMRQQLRKSESVTKTKEKEVTKKTRQVANTGKSDSKSSAKTGKSSKTVSRGDRSTKSGGAKGGSR